MPKKSVAARNGAQRSRPKAQKGFELVRPEAQFLETTEERDEFSGNVSTAVEAQEVSVLPVAPTAKTSASRKSSATQEAVVLADSAQEERMSTTSKGSAAARMANRRVTKQTALQRNPPSLLTAEHFAYVRKDLITIAILATIMFTAIIVLYFTIGKA